MTEPTPEVQVFEDADEPEPALSSLDEDEPLLLEEAEDEPEAPPAEVLEAEENEPAEPAEPAEPGEDEPESDVGQPRGRVVYAEEDADDADAAEDFIDPAEPGFEEGDS